MNHKFDLSNMQNYPKDDWGEVQNIPEAYYKSYWFVVGLKICNEVSE